MNTTALTALTDAIFMSLYPEAVKLERIDDIKQ